MKRYLKLTGFVLIGLVSTLACFFVEQGIASVGSGSNRSAQAIFSLGFTSVLSLLLGGGVTGYLCSQHIKTRFGFIWVTPGLYLLLLEAIIFVIYADQMMPGTPEIMLLVGVLSFFGSWAGIGAGHYVKCEILKPSK